MFFICSIFGLSQFMSCFAGNTTCRWLSPSTISLWPTMTHRINFISFLRCKRPQMRLLLVLLFIDFNLIRLWQITRCLNSIKLFGSFIHLIVFQVVLVQLLLLNGSLEFTGVWMLNGLPFQFLRRASVAVAIVTVEVVSRIVLSWVYDLREISLSSYLLGSSLVEFILLLLLLN